MQISPAIEYHPTLFGASVVIAFAASFAALWIAFQLRHWHSSVAILAKLGSATVMGLAITGMHYTGMAAAQFAPDCVCLAVDSTGGMQSATRALIIGSVTLGILAVTLAIAALDAHFATHSAKMANALQAANEQLRDLALYVNLTGLPNRMLLDDRMAQAATQAERSGKSFALMFLDLDRFKPVNDSLGHHIGDELLMGVAKRLANCIRHADTVARTGGDEFVLVLTEVGDPQDVALVGNKILDELGRPFFIERHGLSISCSIGISLYPRGGRDVATLKVYADMAMYQAKREGRNGYRFFMPEMTMTLAAAGR